MAFNSYIDISGSQGWGRVQRVVYWFVCSLFYTHTFWCQTRNINIFLSTNAYNEMSYMSFTASEMGCTAALRGSGIHGNTWYQTSFLRSCKLCAPLRSTQASFQREIVFQSQPSSDLASQLHKQASYISFTPHNKEKTSINALLMHCLIAMQ